jgi:3',5'-cyclic AMP phosphodiesterase CpdA
MRTIAHLSDIHYGRIDLRVAEGLLEDLAALRPSLVVISGDLVQRAREHLFRAARTFLDRLPAPWLVVPGNHDIPAYNLLARFTLPFRNYRRFISEDLSPFMADDEIAVLGLNTARPLILNFAHGRINHHQIAHLQRVFHSVPATVFKILVTHHPFLPPADSPGTRLVGRARMALPILEACGVDLLLAGHLHRGYNGDLAAHHLEVERSILVGQAATSTSTRLRNEPNSYNLITIDPPEVHFQEREWQGERFVAAEHTHWRREGHRWSGVRVA